MASTTLITVAGIIPSIWAPDIERAREKASALVRSGILATPASVQQQLDAGGQAIDLPYTNPLTGSSEVITTAASMTPAAQTGDACIAPRLFRGKTFSWDDIVDWVRQPGESLPDAAVRTIGQWWAEDEQEILIAALTGFFATAGATTHTYDGTAASATASAIINAAQKLGDMRNKVTALVCHSKVAKDLEVVDAAVTALRPGETDTQLGDGDLFMNRIRVIQDDLCPITTGTPDTYHSYLFTAGSVAYGRANIPAEQAVEPFRAELASQSLLAVRGNIVIQPNGVNYAGAANPTNTTLETGASWGKKWPDKMIGVIQLNTQ